MGLLLSMCTMCVQIQKEARDSIRSHGTGVIGFWRLPNVCAGNQICHLKEHWRLLWTIRTITLAPKLCILISLLALDNFSLWSLRKNKILYHGIVWPRHLSCLKLYKEFSYFLRSMVQLYWEALGICLLFLLWGSKEITKGFFSVSTEFIIASMGY